MKKEDLKCCGNCEHRNSINSGDDQIESCPYETLPSWGICGKWEYDGVNIYHRHSGFDYKK